MRTVTMTLKEELEEALGGQTGWKMHGDNGDVRATLALPGNSSAEVQVFSLGGLALWQGAYFSPGTIRSRSAYTACEALEALLEVIPAIE